MGSEPLRAKSRAGLAVPSLFALVAFVAFIALGTWQVERKAEKEAFVEILEQRLSAPPAPLPAPDRWAGLDKASNEFRRVRFSAAFVPGTQALVYTAGSGARGEMPGPGYWVIAAARLASDKVVAIDRGFVPAHFSPGFAGVAPQPAGSIEMVGAMRWPERRSFFTPKDDPGRNLWFVRDPVAIAAAKGWGEVAPFYIALETPAPPGGWPRPGKPQPNIRNEHLQYAITWYALAAILVIMFGLWVKSQHQHA
jgi:surfeit locus 1 family protein